MSFTEKRLCNPTQLTTSGQTLYTVPASKTSIIKQVVVTNVTASAATFSLYIGSALTSNSLFSATSVAANDTIIINLSQVLSQNEILTALASANSTLNIIISGVENDGPLNPLSIYIADNAITTAKIADASVTTEKIAAGAVATIDIANNAVTQTKLSTDIPLNGFRNAIINGDFRIWQRGTTVTPASGYGYTADRWQTYAYAASATTVTRTAFAAGTTLGNYQPQYHARINSTAAAMFFEQRIEDVSTFAGQTITISFYARHQTAVGVPVYIEQNFGTGGSATTSATANTFSIGTSWQRYTYTVALPSLSGKTIGTSSFLSIYIFSGAINNYLDIWGFQVEQGSQVTPFEQRPIGTELALCQRYYWRNGIYGGGGVGASGTAPIVAVSFKTTMRATPTITYISGGVTMNGLADETITGAYTPLPVRDPSPDGAELLFYKTGAAWTSGQGITVKNAIMQASAEL